MRNDYLPENRNDQNNYQRPPWKPTKVVLWILVLLAAIYEIVITWVYFPHAIAIGLYIVEPLVIWAGLEFIKSNGRDDHTLVALMILEPLLIIAIPYGIYMALVVPLLKLL